MEEKPNLVESLYEKTADYGKTTFELTKLRTVEAVSSALIMLISRMSIVLVFSICVIVLSIGVALWIGNMLGQVYYGFFIVSAFYLLAGIILNLFIHRWLEKPISGMIIDQTLE